MANRVATVNFTEWVDGDTFTARRFNFFQSDGTTALDLSDAVPRVQIRKGSYTGKLMKTATIGDGLTWVSQADGELEVGGFVLDWEGAGDYYYDLQLTYTTSGIIRTYVRGKISLMPQATQNA